MDYLASVWRVALGLLGIGWFVLLTFTDLLLPAADVKTRRQVGVIWGVIFALFAVQPLISSQDAPAFLTAFAVLGLFFGLVGCLILAARPMVYLRPKGLKKVSKYEYRVEQDGIVIRACGLGGPTARRWDRPQFSIFNDSQQPLILEGATLRTRGRTYAAQLAHKRRTAPLTLNPRVAVSVRVVLRFDRPIREAYGTEAEVVFQLRADSQPRQVSIAFEAERSAA